MKKADYIAIHGEEGWKRQLERQAASREKHGPYTGKKNKPICNEFTFTITLPSPTPDDDIPKEDIDDNVRKKADDIAAFVQKEVRKAWAREYKNQNIIIINAGAIRNKKELKYKCEIYQLKMQKQEIDNFQRIVKNIFENVEV